MESHTFASVFTKKLSSKNFSVKSFNKKRLLNVLRCLKLRPNSVRMVFGSVQSWPGQVRRIRTADKSRF